MSMFADQIARDQRMDATAVNRAGAWTLAGLAVVAGLALPDVTGDAGTMTHYMGLLAANQPWNLLVFMVVPVVLAETLAVCELVIVCHQGAGPRIVHQLSRWAGMMVGPWFLGITTYLLANAVIPLTAGVAGTAQPTWSRSEPTCWVWSRCWASR